MTVNRLTPILYTIDIPGTISFYTGILGFQCTAEESGWARLALDRADIMISHPNAHIPFSVAVFTGSFYFRTDDADAMWHQVKNKAAICYPIEDFEYGMREFAIYDNNGYLLQFGHDIASSPE